MSSRQENSTHCLTVDVEDYFHVSAFRSSIRQGDWDLWSSRVERNTELVLNLFEELDLKATFFVLGWVAERYPGLVRRITQAGHELGCHSYAHQLVYEMEPAAFRRDTLRALDVLQQASGQRVTCYRAPSFSITRRSLWALEVLIEAGITHDSSIFPGWHDVYGIPTAPNRPFAMKLAGVPLIEFPPSTLKAFGINVPVTGGGYLRMLPLMYQTRALRRIERCKSPGMLYVHPWELDPEQPRIQASLRSRVRHYTGLYKTVSRLRKLSAEFRFVPMSVALPEQLPIFELADGAFRLCKGQIAPLSVMRAKQLDEEVNPCM